MTAGDPLAQLREYLARPAGAPFPTGALAQLTGPTDPHVFLGLLAQAWRCDLMEPCGRDDRAKILVVEAIVRTRSRAPELVAAIEELHRNAERDPDNGAMSPSADHNDRVLDALRAARDLRWACDAALRALRNEAAPPTSPDDSAEHASAVEIDQSEAMEVAARMAGELDDPWPPLLAAAAQFADAGYLWERAFEAATEARRFALADRIMREQIQTHPDYSAQPALTSAHALVLEELGRIPEALTAIRSAIADLHFDEELLEIERRLYARHRAR